MTGGWRGGEKKDKWRESKRRRPKTGDGKMMVVVGNGAVVVNNALEGAKVVDGAREGDGSLLVESILVLGVLQELHEQRMVDINDRDDEPLLLLANENGQTALGGVGLVPMVVVVKVREMNVEIEVEMLVAAEAHGKRREKREEMKGCYREKGQGSEEEMARVNRVKEESVKDDGMLLIEMLQISLQSNMYCMCIIPKPTTNREVEGSGESIWETRMPSIYTPKE